VLCGALLVAVAGCAANAAETPELAPRETSYSAGSTDEERIELTQVSEHTWVHISYEEYNGSRTASNGMVVETDDGLVLIDTAWSDEQTQTLLDLTEDVFGKPVALAVITHAHVDRIGGIATLHEAGIDVRSTALTAQLAAEQGYDPPTGDLRSELTLKLGGTDLEVYYPGPGHTVDNITVWLPEDRVLFAGCLIKSLDSTSLGNTDDADVPQWPTSIKRALDRYTDPTVVIPGHGNPGGPDLVEHTAKLF